MARGDLPGDLATRYQWVQELGRGAMGVVHRVRDRELGREVALKLIGREVLHDPKKLRRFEREARLLARVRHPGVVRLFDFGVAAGQPYMALELLDGEDLDGAREVDAVAVMRQAAGALEAVHQAGVLHRDLKPANIMRLVDGRVVLVDFGLANADEESTITKSGDVVGSPYFMAPEVLCGRPATPASDFYSWGVTLYRLLEGHAPFRPDTFHAYILGQRPLELAPRRAAPDGPEIAAVRACLDRDPAARPTTRSQLEVLLSRRASPPEPEAIAVVSSPATPPVTPRPAPGGGPWRALVMAGVAGLLLGTLAGRRPGAPPPTPPSTKAAAPVEDPAVGELRTAWRRWSEVAEELAEHLTLTRAEVVDHLPARVDWTQVKRLSGALAEERFLLLLDVLRRRVGSWLAAAEAAPPGVRATHGPGADPFPPDLLRYLLRLAYEADLRMDLALLALVGEAGYGDGERRLREDWGARKLSLRDLAAQVAEGVARLEDPAPALRRAQLAAVAFDPEAAVGPVADRARARLVEAAGGASEVLDALALDMLMTQRFEGRALACSDRAAIQATLLDFEGRVRRADPPGEDRLMLTGRLLESEIRLARLCHGRWSPARRRLADELFQALVAAGERFPATYATILRSLYTTGRGNVPVLGEAPEEIAGMMDEVARRVEALPGEGPIEAFPLGER